MAMDELIISRKSYTTRKIQQYNKSPKSSLSFSYSKDIQWPRLESLPGQFLPPGLMFNTPALDILKTMIDKIGQLRKGETVLE